MLTKTMIRRDTNSASYSRGTDIYRSDEVIEFTVEEADEIDYIVAKVKGSGRNKYNVSAEYDYEFEDVTDIHCDCPAFASYEGYCKHCVAVLLEYIDYKNRQHTIAEYASRLEADRAKLETMRGMKNKNSYPAPAQQSLKTTPAIKQLLQNQLTNRTLLIMQDSTIGTVRLEPLLICDGNNIQLEFKIGITHKYVLKDVFAFTRAIESRANVSYGQKLQFVHTLEAFDAECKPLVQFICNWAKNNKDRYMQNNYNYYYHSYTTNYTPSALRTMPLKGGDLEVYLGAIRTGTVIANVNGTGERTWELTEEALPRNMTISKKSDGIQVKINYLSGYYGNTQNIYFHDGKIYRVEQRKLDSIRDFMSCMADIPNRTIYIQKEDIPAFCRELLPELEQYFVCKKEDFDEKDYGVLPVSFEIYLDAPQKDFITCKIIAVYGENKYNIYDKKENISMRDLVSEMHTGKIASSFCNAYDEKDKVMVVGEDEDKIYEFLVNGVSKLQEVGEVYISDALKRLKIISAPKVAVGVSVTGDMLELKMTSEDMSKEQLLEILTKYNQKKKFYRLKNGDFVNVAGEEIESLLELKQGLHLSETQLKQSTIQIPKYRTLYLDAELKERNSLPVTKDKGFKALVRNMKTVEDNDYDIPDSLEKILREYQKRGYLWIKTLKQNGFCGILADDMGLGKTLQVICYLLSENLETNLQDNRRTLIVCPASLVFNWKNEIDKFAPQLSVKMVVGTSLERQEIVKDAGNKDVLVTSYDLLKRDIECYETMNFHCEIIDEAQFIKNHNTQAAQSVKMVNAGFKLALTGTPIENKLSELWSIFDYLMPGFLYSYQKFRDELELPIVQNQDDKAVRRLQKMITPFVLRRLKKDVLTDLPDKLEENIYATLEGEQQKLYDAHVKKLQILLGKQSEEEFKNSKIQILSELTKLRQICCDPTLLYEDYRAGSAKNDICIELIQNAISGGHKILLFSQFTSMLDHLQEQLKEKNISYYSLTGATSKEKRIEMVEQFNKDDIPVFCISLKAGGTGLNLTAADIVIHYDPWWNIAVQNQATDRAHRIGQKNVVTVYKLIVKGTIEENIIKIQDKKRELADAVLSGEGMSVGSFTRDELLELLKY